MKKSICNIISIWAVLFFLMNQCLSNNIQSHQITGKVIKSNSGKPVIGANILILGTIMGSATDEKGLFIIRHLPPGSYKLMVSAIGFKKIEKKVKVLPGENPYLEISLEETVLMTDGIAITASRYHQSLDDIPVTISLIPSTELDQRNTTSIEQALCYVPGVNTLGGGQISIRGSSGFNWGVGSRVLVLVNGHSVMSGDMWNINWYAIPTSNVKQIEVMKGSGSALYGSSAMGGVINIITKESDGNHFNIRSFSGLYSNPSYESWKWRKKRSHFEGTSVDISTKLGPISTLISSNYKTSTGYKENDDQKTMNFMANLGYCLIPNLRFELITSYGKKQGGFFIYWKDINNPYLNGSDPDGYWTRSIFENTSIFPAIHYVLNNKLFISIKGKLNRASSTDQLQKRSETIPEYQGQFRASQVETSAGELQINYQISPNGIFVIGGDIQNDKVESIQFDSCHVTRNSFYSQYEQTFWKNLRLTLGIRYDKEYVKTGNNARSDYPVDPIADFSRKLGLNFTFSQKTNFRFSLGEGFRVPSITERFISTNTSGIRLEPNPLLQPERSTSVELGMRQSLTKLNHLDLAFFYNHYRDLIEPQLDPDSSQNIMVRFKNIIKARVQGIDFSYRIEWFSQHLSSKIGYTYIDTKDLSFGNEYGKPLKYRSKHTFYLTSDLNINQFQMGIDFRYLSRIERIDEYHQVYIKDIEHVIPTYLVSLRWALTFEHFSFRFLIDNILQYNYLISPANIGPPRTTVIQLNIHY